MTETNQQSREREQPDTESPRPHAGDRSWARQQPVHLIPSRSRLDAPHSVVSIRNTGASRHVVVDRHLTGHEINPGQTVPDIEMRDSDIEYFLRQREVRPQRRMFGPQGQLLPRNRLPVHPLEVLDRRTPEEWKAEQERRDREEERQDQREQERRERDARHLGGRRSDEEEEQVRLRHPGGEIERPAVEGENDPGTDDRSAEGAEHSEHASRPRAHAGRAQHAHRGGRHR